MIKASIMRIVRGLRPLRSIEGEATMAVIVLPPSPGFKALMLLMPKPLCCRVKPGDAMGGGRSPPPLKVR